jgi:hypothetical protein
MATIAHTGDIEMIRADSGATLARPTGVIRCAVLAAGARAAQGRGRRSCGGGRGRPVSTIALTYRRRERR